MQAINDTDNSNSNSKCCLYLKRAFTVIAALAICILPAHQYWTRQVIPKLERVQEQLVEKIKESED